MLIGALPVLYRVTSESSGTLAYFLGSGVLGRAVRQGTHDFKHPQFRGEGFGQGNARALTNSKTSRQSLWQCVGKSADPSGDAVAVEGPEMTGRDERTCAVSSKSRHDGVPITCSKAWLRMWGWVLCICRFGVCCFGDRRLRVVRGCIPLTAHACSWRMHIFGVGACICLRMFVCMRGCLQTMHLPPEHPISTHPIHIQQEARGFHSFRHLQTHATGATALQCAPSSTLLPTLERIYQG